MHTYFQCLPQHWNHWLSCQPDFSSFSLCPPFSCAALSIRGVLLHFKTCALKSLPTRLQGSFWRNRVVGWSLMCVPIIKCGSLLKTKSWFVQKKCLGLGDSASPHSPASCRRLAKRCATHIWCSATRLSLFVWGIFCPLGSYRSSVSAHSLKLESKILFVRSAVSCVSLAVCACVCTVAIFWCVYMTYGHDDSLSICIYLCVFCHNAAHIYMWLNLDMLTSISTTMPISM